MVGKDAEALWGEAAEEQAAGLPGDVKCDDKFLVQTAEVSAAYYEQELKGKDDKALSATLAKLWKQLGEEDKASGSVKKVKSAKLTTRFVFPKNANAARSSAPAAASAAAAAPAPVKSSAPATAAPPSSFLADQHAAPMSAGGAPSGAATPEAETLFAEFSALRKKYDDLVAYTVVLTGERDFLQQDCKDKEGALKKAEAAAKAARAGDASGGGAAAGGGVTATKEATGPAGMAFSQVSLPFLLCRLLFYMGRIISYSFRVRALFVVAVLECRVHV